VDGLRQVRFGQEEAHAQGAVIQYRWLLQSGGIEIINGRIIPDEKKLRLGQESLGEKFAEIAFSEDYDKAKKFVNTWGKKIPELDPLIEKLHDIPVDIKPVFQKWNR
jgi:chromosome condensin MukBEF ATPase and DNA-binding subunit MukB